MISEDYMGYPQAKRELAAKLAKLYAAFINGLLPSASEQEYQAGMNVLLSNIELFALSGFNITLPIAIKSMVKSRLSELSKKLPLTFQFVEMEVHITPVKHTPEQNHEHLENLVAQHEQLSLAH